MMKEVTIDSIRVSLMNYQRVVILKERDSSRILPIWIGSSEADAIAVKLQEVEVARPLTHDLLYSTISTLSSSIGFVVVSELHNDTFHAAISLNTGEGQIEIDCRPSDALALAVRAKAPIYVEETVLDKAGITLDEEGDKPVVSNKEEGKKKQGKLDEQEIRGLSAYKDFINTLDLEDFKRRPS